MFDLPQPSWRHIYAPPVPSLESPGLVKRVNDTPAGPAPRKVTAPGQSRTYANDPTPVSDRWELSRPCKTTLA